MIVRPRWLVAALILLALDIVFVQVAFTQGQPQFGFNVTSGNPQQDLTILGGTVYRDYNSPWSGDQSLNRLRLVRYGAVYSSSNALPGAWYQLGNEINLIEQDNAVRTPAQAYIFATWYHDMVISVKQSNPTAKIIGPSVWNWNGAGGWGSQCCVLGRDSYQWFVDAHLAKYGTLPTMDYIAIQIYPWDWYYWDNPEAGISTAISQVFFAQRWSMGRWPVVVTEWGMLRKDWDNNCTLLPQSGSSRYTYTREVLKGFISLGVPLVLYYSNREQLCDNNGRMSWLINSDGTLSTEGQAHRR